MTIALTEVEVELTEDLYSRGLTWIARQPNGDLVAFETRPERQDPDDVKSPWVVKRGGTVKATQLPLLVSKEKEDFYRVHMKAVRPTNILDIAIKNHLSYLWEDSTDDSIIEMSM